MEGQRELYGYIETHSLFIQTITKSLTGDFNIGSNPSTEEGAEDESYDESKVTVNNLVDNHHLVVCFCPHESTQEQEENEFDLLMMWRKEADRKKKGEEREK